MQAQALFGDFQAEKHGPGTLDPAKELPERYGNPSNPPSPSLNPLHLTTSPLLHNSPRVSVLRQHALTREQWEERIKHAWQKLRGIPKCVQTHSTLSPL